MNHLWTVSTLSAVLAIATPAPANAATFLFSGDINGAQQVPPNSSPATGFFNATLEGTADSWKFLYEVTFSGLSGPLALAHIHLGDRGTTGPVVHDLDAPPLGSTSGTITGDWLSSELPAGVAPATVFNRFLAEGYYFNLHSNTPDFPDYLPQGEIRGQVAAVPEPMTVAGVLVASALGVASRRKKKQKST
ncbi:MAG: PEP-CTERM sorting domain-containing protein [Leptolyngbyaceae cyanobacterium bins.302]|nr:PEP-CTERM sorting domain-containing protein [Leptolyngbyaceae cyanobacterium bins.302]